MDATRNCLSPDIPQSGNMRGVSEKRSQWWQNPLGERQLRLGDHSISPLFFRIHIDSMTGLNAIDQSAESDKALQQ